MQNLNPLLVILFAGLAQASNSTLSIEKSHYGYCWLPSSVTVPRSSRHACTSPTVQLVLLALFNLISMFSNTFLGRGRIREKLKFWRRWHKNTGQFEKRKWTAINGVVWAAMSVAFAACTAGMLGMGDFRASFAGLLLLWLTRPRFGWINIAYWAVMGGEYKETAADALVTECIMGLLSMPFLAQVIRMRGGYRRDDPLCQGDWDSQARWMWRHTGYSEVEYPMRTPVRISAIHMISLACTYPFMLLILVWGGRLRRIWTVPPLILTGGMFIASWRFWFGESCVAVEVEPVYWSAC